MHDPRIGRFFAVNPLTSKYPYYTPYSFSGNKVIHAVELEGLEDKVLYTIEYEGVDSHTTNAPALQEDLIDEDKIKDFMDEHSIGTEEFEGKMLEIYIYVDNEGDEWFPIFNVYETPTVASTKLEKKEPEKTTLEEAEEWYEENIVNAEITVQADIDFCIGVKGKVADVDAVDFSVWAVNILERGWKKKEGGWESDPVATIVGLGDLFDWKHAYSAKHIAKMKGPAPAVCGVGYQSDEWELYGNGNVKNAKTGGLSASYKNMKVKPGDNSTELGISTGAILIGTFKIVHKPKQN